MISVCLIVKNEEKWIEDCLINLKALADEIIIADTGSTDRTMEICQKYGVHLFEHEWKNDFSEARNATIEKATQDWILSFDADERIPFSEIKKIRELIEQIHPNEFIEAVRLTRRDFVQDPSVSNFEPCRGEHPQEERGQIGFYEERMIRLFRNKPHIRWQGKLHELVDATLEGRVVESQVVFHHYGYLSEELERKDKRHFYEAYGNQKIKEEPANWKAFFDHGIEALGAKKFPEAVKALTKAKELNPDFPVIDSNMGYALIEMKEFEKAHSVLDQAVISHPTHADSHLNLGVLLMRQKRYSEAIARFYHLLRVAPQSFLGLRNMGLCYAKMKNPQRAIKCFEQSLEIFPDYLDAKIEMSLVLFMSGQAKRAQRILTDCAVHQPQHQRLQEILQHVNKSLQDKERKSEETNEGPA